MANPRVEQKREIKLEVFLLLFFWWLKSNTQLTFQKCITSFLFNVNSNESQIKNVLQLFYNISHISQYFQMNSSSLTFPPKTKSFIHKIAIKGSLFAS